MITGGYLGRYAGQYFGRYFGGLEQKANQGGGGRRRYRYVTRVRGRYRSFEDELEALAQQDPDIEAGPLPDKPVTVQELRDLGSDAGHDPVRRRLKDQLLDWMMQRRRRVTETIDQVQDRTHAHERMMNILIGRW